MKVVLYLLLKKKKNLGSWIEYNLSYLLKKPFILSMFLFFIATSIQLWLCMF